jgi:hypothetical protein
MLLRALIHLMGNSDTFCIIEAVKVSVRFLNGVQGVNKR